MNYITPTRFDLMAKLLYVKYKDKNINSNFFNELYHKHIITFNNCWEYPGTKTNIKEFFDAFDNLIKDIKENGFNKKFPIEMGKNNVIVNGSHRLMTSFFYNKNVYLKTEKINGNVDYNYLFFLNRKNFPSLERKYADRMALEYIKVNPNLRSMIVYPTGYKDNKLKEIKEIIKEYGYLYYEKEIMLSKKGINNLIKELYRGEKWIGGMFPKGWSPGGKAQVCVDNKPTTIFLIVMNDLNKLIELKSKCRKLYNIGKHSLHISDYMEDTWRIGTSTLNVNSVHFLNNGTNDISEKNKLLLINYFNKIGKNNEDVCLTSSILMEMYGLRMAKDIDYLHKNNIELQLKDVGLHSGKWENYYHKNKDEIIYNPENHFYFNGFKCATLNVVKKMKENRGETKDQIDIKLIGQIL